LLHAYDTQLRDNEGEVLPAGVTRESDGPLFRLFGFSDGQGFVGYRDLGGIEGAALDELIARQIDFFARRGGSSGSFADTIGRRTSPHGCAPLASCPKRRRPC
jgi:hypothetical protein